MPVVAFRVAAEQRGERLDRIVTLAPGARIPRGLARALVEGGAVTLDGRVVRASSHRVRGGEAVRVRLRDEVASSRPEAGPALRILHRDEALVAVEKPAGLPSEPTRDPVRANVLGLLRAQLGLAPEATLELPHRLDRDTSGVLLAGLTREAVAALGAAFAGERASGVGATEGSASGAGARALKLYAAVVHGRVEADEQRIESFLAPNPGTEAFASVRSGGKKAITLVRVLERREATTLVECELLTGRTHQIRVHLSEAGHPIVGDELYGAPPGEHARLGRHLLHARRLEVDHPTHPAGERLVVESPLPESFGESAPRR